MKWIQCFSSLADPSTVLPRFGHSAVCVANTNWGSDLIVVYGGVGSAAGDSAQTALGDVIVLQVDNGTWSAPDILPGSSPGARAFHSAVAVGSRVLVFGGHILTFEAGQTRKRRTFFNDVWQLDTDDWQWSKLAVDTSTALPPGRDMAAWVLLNDTSLLLFGGRSETGKSLQDVWLFDVAKCTWQQLKPDGALPPPRKMHSMVKLGSQVLLFGGERDNGPLDDLWVLRGWQAGGTPRWTQIKMKASPSPRFGHSLAIGPVAAPADFGTGDSSSTGGADEVASSTPACTADALAADAVGALAASTPKSSCGGDGSAAFGQERVVLYGGCLDLSSFLSLNRNYVQSKEAWLLDMNNLMWVQVPSVNEPGAGPSERMCHTMTTLSDGRMLLLGGRHKEGICRDMWWLETQSGEAVVPLSPASAAAPATANTSSGGAQQQASGASTPTRPASQSLLQSLLGPMRQQRDTSQGQQQPAAAPSSIVSNVSEAALPRTPQQQQQQQQQQQDLLQLDYSPAQAAAAAVAAIVPAAPVSSSNTSQQQQQLRPQLPKAPAAAPFAAAQPAADSMKQPPPPPPPPHGFAATASSMQQPSNYYSGYSGSSSTGQPLAALMDSSGELAKLIRNPAAYSADAINKLSSSVTSTVNSLQQQLPGALAGALPAALQHVAPNLLSQTRTNSSGSSGSISGTSGMQQVHPGWAALRAQLGLPSVVQQQQQAITAGPCMAPGSVLQELARLGQQLLGDDSADPSSSSSAWSPAAATALGGPRRTPSGSFTSSSSLPPDVLVSAARQHLMSAAVAQLHIAQVALLLADYQHLAAAHFEQQMLARLSEGFSAATDSAANCASTFLQRQPHELLLNQVEQLQAEYKQLITDAPA